MNPYRRISALLAFWIAVCSLASCSQAGQEQAETSPSPSVVETEAIAAPETENPAPPVTEYDGYEFRIGCCDYQHFIDQDELTGDRLGDAIYERNRQVEDLYKVEITAYKIGSYQDVVNAVKKGVQAGDDFSDLVYTPIIPLLQSAYAAPEQYINLRTLEKLDLNDGWWDPALTDEVTIRDFCPIVTGNAIITDELGLCTIMFNSTLFRTIYPGESLYDLAVEGNWTFDRMQRYAEGAVLDLDGDNPASRRTAEKSGFRLFEKRTVYDYHYNRYCDDYYYFRRYWSGCTLKDRFYGDSPYYGRSTSDREQAKGGSV